MKLLRTRLIPAAPRLKVPRVEASDPTADERAQFYGSAAWKRLRASMVAERCALCNATERLALDHLVGHGDALALPLLRAFGLPEQNWRIRLAGGPFITLCHSHHSEKTAAEVAGRLGWWLKEHQAALGFQHIQW